MKNPEMSRVIEYQAKPESYEVLKVVHRLLTSYCEDGKGPSTIEAKQLDEIKSRLAAKMPHIEDIDTFFEKARRELAICGALHGSFAFKRFVYVESVSFTSDLYQNALANAPALEEFTLATISARYVPPLQGPKLTNQYAAQIAAEKARHKS